MTAKRFQWVYIKDNLLELRDNGIVKVFNNDRLEELLNELHEENKELKEENEYLCEKIKENEWHWNTIDEDRDVWRYKCKTLEERNEQLKQDRNALIHLLENQSMIIQELHSKLLEYQVKEPIVLTKEDLNLMGKAISYYTHGRYGE